jgi:hypothetical protein
MLNPLTSDGCRGNGNTTLALLFHVIGHRSSIVNFTNAVNHASVKKNTLSKRRLPRINVRSDPNIPRPFQRVWTVWIIRILGHGVEEGYLYSYFT